MTTEARPCPAPPPGHIGRFTPLVAALAGAMGVRCLTAGDAGAGG